MSIATAITNAQNKIAACYTAISGKGGTLPATQDLANMPTSINSISGGVTVNPLSVTENGSYTAPTGTAYSPVTVNVSGGVSGVVKANIDANGVASMVANTVDLNLSSLTQVDTLALYQWQMSNISLSGQINFSELIEVKTSGLGFAFRGCTGLTGSPSFPKLQIIANSGLSGVFFSCTNITGSVLFPSLTSIHPSAFSNAFYGCTGITELHFKSSMSSTIQAATGYTSKFGATNATIYFDL